MNKVSTAQTIISPGKPVLASGEYEIHEKSGRPTGRYVYLTKGDRAPPVAKKGQRFRLLRAIETLHTTAASAAAIDEASERYSEVLKRLAEK